MSKEERLLEKIRWDCLGSLTDKFVNEISAIMENNGGKNVR